MKLLTQVSRILVGALFIFSGLIKLNDPVGFSFKLDEYFAPDVLNLPFLQPLALSLAVFIVILEVLLGVALLLGQFKKLTVGLLLAMIVFFTFLTFYSAYFNKVTDCGCFGDAIPLTPWQSFGKDVILTVLILIISLNLKYIKPVLSTGFRTVAVVVSLLFCIGLGYYVLNHLPVLDFRAYAEGKSIVEGMKSAEEKGLQPTTYLTIYTLKNKNTGKEREVNSDEYMAEKWWEKKEWEILSDQTKTKVKEHGYEPPVHDFLLLYQDEDITQRVLEAKNAFLIISYNVSKANAKGFEPLKLFAQGAQNEQHLVMGLSASLEQEVEAYRHEHQLAFPFATADGTTLKTIIRSNPGLVWLQKGVVKAKWHYNDVPTWAELAPSL